MKNIRFRAWVPLLKVLEEVNRICFASKNVWLEKSGCVALGNLILLQYTGLEDKNGKEIYEGDIIRSKNGLTTSVEWNSDIDCDRYWRYASGFTIYLKDDSDNSDHAEPDELEVIGNIYEHPELVEAK